MSETHADYVFQASAAPLHFKRPHHPDHSWSRMHARAQHQSSRFAQRSRGVVSFQNMSFNRGQDRAQPPCLKKALQWAGRFRLQGPRSGVRSLPYSRRAAGPRLALHRGREAICGKCQSRCVVRAAQSCLYRLPWRRSLHHGLHMRCSHHTIHTQSSAAGMKGRQQTGQ